MKNSGSFTALSKLKSKALDLFSTITAKLPVKEKNDLAANVRRNWYLPISAGAYFLLNVNRSLKYQVGILVAVAIILIIASQIRSVWDYVKGQSFTLKVVSALTAAGICWGG